MKTVYLWTAENRSPDALRSTWNPPILYLSREPQLGNSGDYPEIVDGWLGQTNDCDRSALGEFDLDDAESVAALAEACEEYPIRFNIDQIREWFTSGVGWNESDDDYSDDGDTDYCFPLDGRQHTKSLSWDERDEEFYGIRIRDGWVIVAGWDQANGEDVECLSKILDSAGIKYDLVTHATYSSNTNGVDWEYVLVRTDDRDTANAAIRAFSEKRQAELLSD